MHGKKRSYPVTRLPSAVNPSLSAGKREPFPEARVPAKDLIGTQNTRFKILGNDVAIQKADEGMYGCRSDGHWRASSSESDRHVHCLRTGRSQTGRRVVFPRCFRQAAFSASPRRSSGDNLPSNIVHRDRDSRRGLCKQWACSEKQRFRAASSSSSPMLTIGAANSPLRARLKTRRMPFNIQLPSGNLSYARRCDWDARALVGARPTTFSGRKGSRPFEHCFGGWTLRCGKNPATTRS